VRPPHGGEGICRRKVSLGSGGLRYREKVFCTGFMTSESLMGGRIALHCRRWREARSAYAFDSLPPEAEERQNFLELPAAKSEDPDPDPPQDGGSPGRSRLLTEL
jgi:hypothetical protein